MSISNKIPIIASVILVLLWVFLGFISAERIEGESADPAFFRDVKLTEDVSAVDLNKVVDAVLDEKEYDYTDIQAGSVGNVYIIYGRRHHIINNPETDSNLHNNKQGGQLN